jgi:hypothetical protein
MDVATRLPAASLHERCGADVRIALTRRGSVATVRSGPERSQGPGGRSASGSAERPTDASPKAASPERRTHRSPGSPGRLGPPFDGSRNRVDNARVWGRRERIQRFLGPSISFPDQPSAMTMVPDIPRSSWIRQTNGYRPARPNRDATSSMTSCPSGSTSIE